MYTKSKMFAKLVTVVFILLSLNINAQSQPTQQGSNAKPNQMPMLKQIPDLTADQEAKIKSLHTNLLKVMLPLKNELAEKKAHLQTLSTAEKADMKAINQTIDEISLIKTKMAKLHAQFRQDVRALLTEDQRLAFDMRAGKGNGKNGKGCQGNGNGGSGSCKSECNGQGPKR